MISNRLSFLAMLAFCLAALAVLVWATALAQTQSTLTVGGFTLSVPSANPTVMVNAPAKNGTLALLEDVPPPQPGAKIFAGSFPVNGSATFSGMSGPFICTLSPRFTTSANGLQVSGVDYVCSAKNN